MKPTDNQIRDLGFMFQKMWNQEQVKGGKGLNGYMLNGFVMALDALGIPWRLVPDNTGNFTAVEIADKTFKLKGEK